jgi:hypothetical protein
MRLPSALRERRSAAIVLSAFFPLGTAAGPQYRHDHRRDMNGRSLRDIGNDADILIPRDMIADRVTTGQDSTP